MAAGGSQPGYLLSNRDQVGHNRTSMSLPTLNFNCFNPLSVETYLSLNKLIELNQYKFVLKHLKECILSTGVTLNSLHAEIREGRAYHYLMRS